MIKLGDRARVELDDVSAVITDANTGRSSVYLRGGQTLTLDKEQSAALVKELDGDTDAPQGKDAPPVNQ